jgi:hypothetical protein
MSLSNAEMYGRRARDASDAKTVGDNAKRAIDELIKAIKDLDVKVRRLEARTR